MTASFLIAQTVNRPADIVGMALVGHHVADLDRAIKFFQAVDFKMRRMSPFVSKSETNFG